MQKEKKLQSSVRKPAGPVSPRLLLQILELQHAVLLHVEELVADGDIAGLNNAVRSRLDEAWRTAGSSFSEYKRVSDGEK